MKAKLSNIWVRIIAYITGTLSGLAIVICILAMVLMYAFGAKDKALAMGNEVIADNYAAYIMANYWEEPDKVIERIKKTNLYVTIIEDGSSEKDGTGVYTNVPNGSNIEYTYFLEECEIGSRYHYNIDYLLGALQSVYSYVSNPSYWPTVQVQKIVLDTTNDLFYFQTEAGYFPCDYIIITEEGLRYDYSLETRNGERGYYNSYYEKKLNTDNYANWTEIGYEDIMYRLDANQIDGKLVAISDSSIIQQSLLTVDFLFDEGEIRYHAAPEHVYTIALALNPTLENQDLFKDWSDTVGWLYSFGDAVVIYEILAVIVLLISIAVLIYTAESDKEKLKFRHKIPVCIYLISILLIEIILGVLVFGCLHMGANDMELNISIHSAGLLLAQIVACMILIMLMGISNFAVRIKTKTLFRHSELYYICKPFVTLWRYAKENISLFWKASIVVFFVDFVELLVVVSFAMGYYYEQIVVGFVLYKIVQYFFILFAIMQMSRLQKGSARIANGDLSPPIDTSKMFWEFKKHGENINTMGDGIAKAVESQLKSERLKTELITNVSHDIKTPLTSIINYVDLMKKEEITDATICEYVDVLDRQSARLKKLIEDLMEASKASTGNLKVELVECDVSVLITQVAGEFEDRFATNGLEVIVTKPKEPVLIMADGRHMWRVLDNLMNNIYKYSLLNSRVYIQLEKTGDKVVVQFKNISKTQLNISSDELMERFVRGDSSRNTEGSGLGLSIAQSLTELMGGNMRLDIDGDLFKVTLTFLALS